MKEDIDVDEKLKISCLGEIEIMKLKRDNDSFRISPDTLMLSPDSREVVVNIADYTDKKRGREILKGLSKGSGRYCPFALPIRQACN